VKSPGVAAVLAFFVPGLGHLYCGRIGSGLAWFILLTGWTVATFPAGSIISVPLWIWQIVIAYRLASE